MKIVIRVLVVLAVIVGIALALVVFRGGAVIKHGVNRLGPHVLGVDVTLEHARFYPLRGHVSLSGLAVGNPEGFHTDNLFQAQHLEVHVNMRSLLTDTIIIDRILVTAPTITYEVGMRGTNIGTLVAQLEERWETEEEIEEDLPDVTDPVLEETDKIVVIKELVLADARAQVSATAMRGREVPVELSTITLNDLGGEDQSVTQIVTEVFKALLSGVTNAVSGAGDLLGDGLKSTLEGVGALGESATEGTRAVTDSLGEGARGLRDRLQSVGD